MPGLPVGTDREQESESVVVEFRNPSRARLTFLISALVAWVGPFLTPRRPVVVQ